MDTWLVTGSSGFLGYNIGKILSRNKRKLIGIARSGNSTHFEETHNLDLTDLRVLSETIIRIRPQVIIHAAALSSHETCQDEPNLAHLVNAEATRVIAQTASQIDSTLHYISTDAVFSGQTGHYKESDSTSPFSVYGQTKLLGEQYAMAENPKTSVVRTNFFGWSPTKTRSILEFFYNSLRDGRCVNGYTDFKVSSIYVKHLVEYLAILNDVNFQGLVHIASSDALSKYEFGVLVAKRFGFDSNLIRPVLSTNETSKVSRQRDLSLNTNYLNKITGLKPPSQDIGVTQAKKDLSSI